MSEIGLLLLSRIEKATEEHGGVSDFCRRAGLVRRTVDRWLSGEREPPLEALPAIARALEREPWQLIKPEDSIESPILAEISSFINTASESELKSIQALVRGLKGVRGDTLEKLE